MSFSANKTFELWRNFMPDRDKIKYKAGKELYSLEVYPDSYFDNFNPGRVFEKWAAAEVSDYEEPPAGMERLIVPSGIYAVFIHKGPASEGPKTYEYIFRQWLPKSDYRLDNRPHMAVMGEKYNRDSSFSEEEIRIPVKPK
jgi:AraC family transcriptional regulator